MAETFFWKCIDLLSLPVVLGGTDKSITDEFEIVPEIETTQGRLGMVLFLSLSGVAAVNCKGYTFHNALPAGNISKKSLSTEFSPQIIAKLK